jgi:hypothetical protein
MCSLVGTRRRHIPEDDILHNHILLFCIIKIKLTKFRIFSICYKHNWLQEHENEVLLVCKLMSLWKEVVQWHGAARSVRFAPSVSHKNRPSFGNSDIGNRSDRYKQRGDAYTGLERSQVPVAARDGRGRQEEPRDTQSELFNDVPRGAFPVRLPTTRSSISLQVPQFWHVRKAELQIVTISYSVSDRPPVATRNSPNRPSLNVIFGKFTDIPICMMSPGTRIRIRHDLLVFDCASWTSFDKYLWNRKIPKNLGNYESAIEARVGVRAIARLLCVSTYCNEM